MSLFDKKVTNFTLACIWYFHDTESLLNQKQVQISQQWLTKLRTCVSYMKKSVFADFSCRWGVSCFMIALRLMLCSDSSENIGLSYIVWS